MSARGTAPRIHFVLWRSDPGNGESGGIRAIDGDGAREYDGSSETVPPMDPVVAMVAVGIRR